MKNLGIAVVDMQETFLKSVLDEDREKIILTHRKLFTFAKDNDLPTFVFYMSLTNAISLELPRELLPLKTHYFYKEALNGFNDTFAGIAMQSLRISQLIISGVYRSDCVCETARGARERGMQVYSSLDITADPKAYSKNYPFSGRDLLGEQAQVFDTIDDLLRNISCHHSN